jgi:hypothetical protein
LDDSCPQSLLSQQGLVDKALKGLMAIDLSCIGLIQLSKGQMVFEILQCQDLTVYHGQDLVE